MKPFTTRVVRRVNFAASVAAVAAMLLSVPAARVGGVQAPARAPAAPPARQGQTVRDYVKGTWSVLTRSVRDLPRAAPDPKMHRAPGEPWPLYIASDEDRDAVVQSLRAALKPEALAPPAARPLPASRQDIREPGLLYLPNR